MFAYKLKLGHINLLECSGKLHHHDKPRVQVVEGSPEHSSAETRMRPELSQE